MVNPQMSTETYSPDNLIAGDDEHSDEITLLSGENRARSTLLGRVNVVLGTATADGGNTGDGAISGYALLTGAQVGTYRIECIEVIAAGGRFSVLSPKGKRLADYFVGQGAYSTQDGTQINITIADGGTDFALADFVLCTVTAGSLKYVMSLSTAVDGSETPTRILSVATDASAADKVTGGYLRGTFDQNSIVFGASHTIANTKEALAALGIYLVDSRKN